MGVKRGMKKQVFKLNQVKPAACPVCGASGSAPCVSQGNGTAMKNNHKGRV